MKEINICHTPVATISPPSNKNPDSSHDTTIKEPTSSTTPTSQNPSFLKKKQTHINKSTISTIHPRQEYPQIQIDYQPE